MGVGMTVANSYMNYRSSRAQAEAQYQAIKANAVQAITNMNYAIQNFEMQRRNALEASVQELMDIKLQARQLQGNVNAALAERSNGNTARLLSRSTNAMAERSISQTKQNYIRKSEEIDHSKEQEVLSTQHYVNNLKAPRKPNLWTFAMNLGQGLLEYKNSIESRQADKRAIVGDKNYQPWHPYDGKIPKLSDIDIYGNKFHRKNQGWADWNITIDTPSWIAYGKENYDFPKAWDGNFGISAMNHVFAGGILDRKSDDFSAINYGVRT